jgi:hypothetical protein
MLQMLDDLFLFWGWKWAKKARAGQLTYKTCVPYKYALPDESDRVHRRDGEKMYRRFETGTCGSV